MSKILNQFGQPYTAVQLQQAKMTAEIATRNYALGYYPGFFNYLPDPDPILRKLGIDQTVYNDLLNDTTIGSLVNRRKNLTKSLDWNVDYGDDASEKEVELCNQVIDILSGKHKTKIKDIISQSLNPIFFGYSVFEVVWQKVGKYFLPVKVEEKPREWFFFDNDNNLRFRTHDNWDGIPITGKNASPELQYKFILLQNDPTYNNPYGDKVLSRCFYPGRFKNQGWKSFARFIHKYGLPYMFGKLPRTATREQHLALLSDLENMVEDVVGTGPDDSSLEVLEPNKSGSTDLHTSFIQQCKNDLAEAILTNSMSVSIQKVGARSASETGAETIEGNLSEEDRDFPAELMDQVFTWTVDLNIGSGKYPKFTVFELDDYKKDLSERDKNLYAIGFRPNKNYIREKYNIEEELFELSHEAVSGAEPQPVASVAEPQNHFSKNKFSFKDFFKKVLHFASGKNYTDEDIAGQITDAVPEKALQFAMEETLNPVFELAKKSTSKEEFQKGLAALYPQMKTDQLEQLLPKAILIAELEGLNRVQNEE